MKKMQVVIFATMVLGSVTLQAIGTVVGIVGGLAGIYALVRVNRVADPLEDFIKEQRKEVVEHKSKVEEIAPPNPKRKR